MTLLVSSCGFPVTTNSNVNDNQLKDLTNEQIKIEENKNAIYNSNYSNKSDEELRKEIIEKTKKLNLNR